MLGKIEGKKGEEGDRMRWLDDITHWMDTSLNKLQQIVKEREAWRAAVHEVAVRRDLATEQQQIIYSVLIY